MAEKTQSGARTSAQFEAALRKRARPVLSPAERAKLAQEKALEEHELAAARCREAAATQLKRAEAWEEKARALRAGQPGGDD